MSVPRPLALLAALALTACASRPDSSAPDVADEVDTTEDLDTQDTTEPDPTDTETDTDPGDDVEPDVGDDDVAADVDTELPDTELSDTDADTGPEDTDGVDTSVTDTANDDTANEDTRVTDTEVDAADTDAGTADTDADTDTGLEDTGPEDTGTTDTGTTDVGVDVPEWTYPAQRVGMFYLTWHAYASDAIRQLPEDQRLTVEEVIQSPTLGFSDMLDVHGLRAQAANFHYHVEPELGFYCLYRPRPGEPEYAEPNAILPCPNITEVATRHAQQLWDAGVDFVYVDLTNLPGYSTFTDVLGLRPFEVLLEEWTALRASGHPTPQIAAWVPATEVDAVPTYEHLLALYADPAYADLLLHHDGQPVMFIVDHGGLPASDDHLAAIARAGVLPVRLWGNLQQDVLDSGTAGWMQPCREGTQWTTWIRPDQACNQGYTTTSPLGTVLSVSLAYQVSYASLPFRSPGRYDGLTLKKQFETAFTVQPDYLLINAWNEHIAQPQPNPHVAGLGALARSMGEADVDPSDPGADWLWVDMYGYGQSRDFEPSVEDGDADYQLLRSCLRVYRSGHGCGDAGMDAEACCQLGPGLTLVRSVRGRDTAGAMNTHHVLTTGTTERDSLVGSGAWEEVCHPIWAPPGICDGGDSGDGPFFLWGAPGPDREVLYRCYTGVANFFSRSATCEGTEVVGPLGWISTVRNSETPRSLRRCYNTESRTHFHWLDGHCPDVANVREESVIGYVR